ncbi:MAG: purine-nucleoside phosphorylase [Rubripirellula sp.]|nr:purine-nucleoside phosphorylase [Rubripirellula sp.]
MLDQAIERIRSRTTTPPAVAIVLGSGLGGLADLIDAKHVIPFKQIPGMASASAAGHRGELIIGQLESVPVVAMAGRLHRYEGWTHAQAVYPIRLMAALGAKRLIVSNAAGGVNPQLRVGEIVVIRDHINLIPNCIPSTTVPDAPSMGNPAGVGVGRRGDVYDARMSRTALQAAVNAGFAARQGTYLATLGPTYETRSEYRMMRRIGADVAGMSTVPEVLAAKEENLRILGISMVSNVATPDIATKTDHQEVLEAGQAAETKMEAIVRAVLRDESAG